MQYDCVFLFFSLQIFSFIYTFFLFSILVVDGEDTSFAKKAWICGLKLGLGLGSVSSSVKSPPPKKKKPLVLIYFMHMLKFENIFIYCSLLYSTYHTYGYTSVQFTCNVFIQNGGVVFSFISLFSLLNYFRNCVYRVSTM